MRRLWQWLFWAGLATLLLASVSVALAKPPQQSAEEGKKIFQEKCAGCHTIGGGDLIGPDLQGVTTRRNRDWLEKFIRDPNALFAAGDADAQALLDRYHVRMPALGLSDEEIEAVLAYLETTAPAASPTPPAATPAGATPSGGASPAQPTATPAPSPAPLAGNPAVGQRLFTGQTPFAKGGVACMACHHIAGIGGGTMGPDLTHVAARYPGQALAGALKALPFPVMREVYAGHPLSPEEQQDLQAFLEQANAAPGGSGKAQTSRFLGWGLAGTVLLFGILLLGWPRQRESLSDRLRRQA